MLPSSALVACVAFLVQKATSLVPHPTVVTNNGGTDNTTPTHPPPPTTHLPPLPSQFSGFPSSLYDCWNSHFGYTVTSQWLLSEFVKSSTAIRTTYSPPLSGSVISSYQTNTSCTTTPHGLTTLCDGFPRATRREVNCELVTKTITNSWTAYVGDITVIAPTWTSSIHNPRPTCGPEYNLKPECERILEAYRYMLSSLGSSTATPNPSASQLLRAISWSAIPPCTVLAAVPTQGARPTCKLALKKKDYSIYYWPLPPTIPSNSTLCSNSTTTPTPTTSLPLSTTVVSGHTLTSPTIYHILRSPTLSIYTGLASSPGPLARYPTSLWNTTQPASPLTIAHDPSSPILSASKVCHGREADYCTVHLLPSFSISHITAVPREAYERNCQAQWHCFARTCDALCTGGTIWQDFYSATVGVAMSEVVRQNAGMVESLEECGWLSWEAGDEGGWMSYSSSAFAALTVGDLPSGAFVAIQTGASTVNSDGDGMEGKAVPRSGSVDGVVVAPTPTEI